MSANLFTKKRVAFLAAGGLTAAAVTATGAMAAVDTEHETAETAGSACEIQEQPVPDDTVMSTAQGVDVSGDVAVGTSAASGDVPDQQRQPLLWREGHMEPVDLPGQGQILHAVNSDSTAVGAASVDGDETAFVYDNGEARQLPGVDSGNAVDVNENGLIVGHSHDGDAQSIMLWADADTEPVGLEAPDDSTAATALAVGDDGVVVGFYEDADKNLVPYQWNAYGEGSELPLPSDIDAADVDDVSLDLADGWIAGTVWTDGADATTSLRWASDADEPEVLEGLTEVNAVNAEGVVVGQAGDDAALAADGEPMLLPGLIDEPGGQGDTAMEVSDDGATVVGQAVYDADPDEGDGLAAVEWNCD